MRYSRPKARARRQKAAKAIANTLPTNPARVLGANFSNRIGTPSYDEVKNISIPLGVVLVSLLLV
jgi:hypothetical protein